MSGSSGMAGSYLLEHLQRHLFSVSPVRWEKDDRRFDLFSAPGEGLEAAEIARRSRGTPRVANRLLRRVRDYAEVRAKGQITTEVAQDALKMLGVDEHGLDEVDRNLLLTIIQKYSGGPVGLNTIAASLSEEEDAIEEIYEPYLMQLGLLDRTQRGRVATALAYKHFGLPLDGAPAKDEPRRQPGLFS